MVEVILLQLLHKCLDLCLLILDEIVEGHLHPHEHSVGVSALLLHSKIFLAVEEVVFGLELVPQLLAPFRQDSEDGWALNDEVTRGNLFLTVDGNVLGDLPSNCVVSVLLHLCRVLLLLRALGVIVFGDHLLAFRFSQILHGLDAPFVHPSLVADILKDLGDILVKSLIDGGLVLRRDVLVDLCHEPIEEPHDEFIIITILPVGEYYIAFLE